MRSITFLTLEIYQKANKIGMSVEEKIQATKNIILTEITQWTVKELVRNNDYFFTPVGFKPTLESPPFEVRLAYNEEFDMHELKFGDMSSIEIEDKYRWSDTDPFRLQKALFLYKVLNRISKLLEKGDLDGITFAPWSGDGLGSDRMSYFKNMFKKINGGKFEMIYRKDLNLYIIQKKINNEI